MAHPSVSPPDRSAGGEEAYSPPETLTAPIGTGIKWKLASQILREGTRLGVGILLARLLTPAEWGVATIAMAVASFLTMLAEVGLPVALVQRARISEADRSTMALKRLRQKYAFYSALRADHRHQNPPFEIPGFRVLTICKTNDRALSLLRLVVDSPSAVPPG